jgi:glycerol-3-phosphate acyltransferase PlsY
MALIVAYLLGAIPVGLLIVKWIRGRDIRYWFSGRTGGTNVMRIAGFWPGFLTGIADIAKGTLAVVLAGWLTNHQPWIEMIAGLLAVIGHNYSIFLLQQKEGKLHFHGGAGGATTLGAAGGLWFPALLIIIPIALFFLFIVGYASMATMSIALCATLIFLWRAIIGVGSWAHFLFGVLAEVMLLWALRPNIRRLFRGEERIVGLRARRNR